MDILEQELYHYGVLGQRKGVRRYQNYDGSLTPEGRIHYGYSDRRRETKLRRGIDSSKKNLRSKAEDADSRREYFDQKVSEYEKEKKRFRPFNRSQKKIDVNNALARVNKAERLLWDKQREVNIAEDIYRDYEKAYGKFVKDMTKKYGHDAVRDLRRKDFQASKNYIFKDFIDPGITIASLPMIGPYVIDRYVSDSERRKRLRYM